MKLRGLVNTLFPLLAASSWGCSSSSTAAGTPAATGGDAGAAEAPVTPSSGADAGAGGRAEPSVGAAGASPQTPSADCTVDRDCDDGKACNGAETCVNGACRAGAAPSCAPNRECSDPDGGACVFTDGSPWVVYQADDDTPGVPEAYAVKQALAGKMDPIKLNEPLEAGWSILGDLGWAPAQPLYVFVAQQESTRETKLGFVYFDAAGPRPATLIEGYGLRWSPSGRFAFVKDQHGVSIYAPTAGKLTQVVHEVDPARDNTFARWTKNDELFFTLATSDRESTVVRRAAPGPTAWSVDTVIDDLEGLEQLDVSPDGSALIYEQAGDAGQRGPLYVVEPRVGSEAHVLAPAGEHSLVWSPDGSRLLLIQDVAGEPRAFLSGAAAYAAAPVAVAPSELVLGGEFSLDGSKVLLWKPVSDWGKDVSLLDEAASRTSSTLGRAGLQDLGPRWAGDGDTAIMATRAAAGAEAKLQLVSASGQRSETLDTIPADQSYDDYAITPRAEFVAYAKGSAPSLDGAYIDLRYHGDHQPIRMPGEGNLWSFRFDDSGHGLYYVRQAASGARDCFYLELSGQIAAAPVKLNGPGRVDVCSPEPAHD